MDKSMQSSLPMGGVENLIRKNHHEDMYSFGAKLSHGAG